MRVVKNSPKTYNNDELELISQVKEVSEVRMQGEGSGARFVGSFG